MIMATKETITTKSACGDGDCGGTSSSRTRQRRQRQKSRRYAAGAVLLVAAAVLAAVGADRCSGFSSSTTATTRTAFSRPRGQQRRLQRTQHASAPGTQHASAPRTTRTPALSVSISPQQFDDDGGNNNNNKGNTVAEGTAAAEEGEGQGILDKMLSGYLGPRLVLGALACFYATNFPLGSIMADAFPSPSAATSARMLLAALALSPNLPKIDPSLRGPAVATGCFTALGYISQSFALVDTNPATVSFLGSATVLVCPLLEWLVDKKPMSVREAPQTWLAAILCLAGVGALELWDPATNSFLWDASAIGRGDALALLQAVGFGTQVYLCERMVRDKPSQALPVTATLIATTALLSCAWCFADGWMFQPGAAAFALPQLFFEPSLRTVAGAVVWTGFVSTALNLFVEMSALGRVSSAEASVILATEPMWSALFAAVLLGEHFGVNDTVGGSFMVLACLANSLKPSNFEFLFGRGDKDGSTKKKGDSLEQHMHFHDGAM